MTNREPTSRSSLTAVGESLRALARLLDEEAAASVSVVPDAPEVDYNALNYKNLEEAAEALGVSDPLMRQLVHADGFPAYKLGSRWIIPKVELAEWNAKQARERAAF